MSEQTLYRLFDSDGVLLYVGITADPGKRWKQHASEKTWWPEVATMSIEKHEDRPAALAAERKAIVAELPRYNRDHNAQVLAARSRLSAPLTEQELREDDLQLSASGEGPIMDRLANAGRKTEHWRSERDRLIREASERGGSLREIATAVGLTNPGVLRIVRRDASPPAQKDTK